MNFLTEYKDEVGSLCLSAEFKESLKKACISEAAKAAKGDKDKPQIELSEGGASNKEVMSKMKLYKYISIAACLVAVISSIGVVSLMSSRIKTKSYDAYQNRSADSESDVTADGDDVLMNSADADVDDVADEEYAPNEPATASNGIDPMSDEPVQGYYDSEDTPVDKPLTEETEPADDDDSQVYSITMNSPDYDGDYNTEDYILMLNSSAQVENAKLYDDVSELKEAIPEDNSPENSIDSTESGEQNAPESREASDYTALNFYDLLAAQLKQEAESGGASLIRMRIEGKADSGSSPAPYSSGLYTPYDVNIEYDYLNQTGCDVNARVWIKGTEENQIEGMPIYSKGDTILTSLYVNENGSVTVVDELLYDVYNMSGQDIAYHRYYERINPGYTDMGILEQESSFVTTTENNPVKYVHKAVTKELSRYIRRKIVGENYNFVDLEWLGKVSVGEADPWQEPEPEPEDNQNPDDTQEPEDNTDVPEREPIKNARVRTTDEKMIITVAGEQIKLSDEASCEYIESTFKNSASSTSSTDYYSIAMFVGGKLTFNSNQVFKGGLTAIEISSVGCPLNLRFNGVSVGDSLESAVETLGIREPLDPNCTLTYKGTTITATMKFEYGTLAKIVIK